MLRPQDPIGAGHEGGVRADSAYAGLGASFRIRDFERDFRFACHAAGQRECPRHNAPSDLHDVQACNGHFLDAFYNDILVYSNTRRTHLRYLRIIFSSLSHYKFYLSQSKVELMVPRMEVLGMVLDGGGITVMPQRWEMVRMLGWSPQSLPRSSLSCHSKSFPLSFSLNITNTTSDCRGYPTPRWLQSASRRLKTPLPDLGGVGVHPRSDMIVAGFSLALPTQRSSSEINT